MPLLAHTQASNNSLVIKFSYAQKKVFFAKYLKPVIVLGFLDVKINKRMNSTSNKEHTRIRERIFNMCGLPTGAQDELLLLCLCVYCLVEKSGACGEVENLSKNGTAPPQSS